MQKIRLRKEIPIEDFYALKGRAIWAHFKQEHFSFWMICAYLFVEYVRPQSIIPAIDFLPWAKVFLALTLIARLADSKSKWVSDPTNIWITLFFAAILLSSCLAVYPSFSWPHLMDFLGWYVIYFLIINTVNTEKRYLIFLGIFLLCSFKLSFFGARTWAMRGFSFTTWGLQGPPGFFQNSGELSIQMLMFSPVAYQLAVFIKPYASSLKHKFLLFFPLTGAMTVMGASSRGGQIALVYQLYRTLIKGRWSIKVLLVVTILTVAGWSLLPPEQKARFASAGEDQTSQQRLLYLKHGVEIVRDHPVLGIGYFNFPPYFAAHWPGDVLKRPAYVNGIPVSELPHNIFIQIATDTGLVGFSLFLILVWRTIKIAMDIRKLSLLHLTDRKPFEPLAKGLVIALWGFLIAGQFVTVAYYPFFWINLALSVALHNIAKSHWPVARREKFPCKAAL